MRYRIYRFLRKLANVEETCAAPNWIYWIGKNILLLNHKPYLPPFIKYDWRTDTLTVNGKKWSVIALKTLSTFNGNVDIIQKNETTIIRTIANESDCNTRL